MPGPPMSIDAVPAVPTKDMPAHGANSLAARWGVVFTSQTIGFCSLAHHSFLILQAQAVRVIKENLETPFTNSPRRRGVISGMSNSWLLSSNHSISVPRQPSSR